MDGAGAVRFDRFVLDAGERQLLCDGRPLDLNSRYLDALILLVRERGRLVSKERFLDEVWRGIPVTDEALTQGIKTLRRQLGDDAARPRFIETVPKHGYRFIAPVEQAAGAEAPAAGAGRPMWRAFAAIGAAGTVGGGVAGVLGGLIYGFAAASQPFAAGPGGISAFLVLLCLTVAIALLGGAGVAFGTASACLANRGSPLRPLAGGAAGGLVVGALVKMIGTDAFTLVFGRSPGDVTGAAEGAAIGAAIGLGYWLGTRPSGPGALRTGVALAALLGAVAGIVIVLLGGQMMGGSLNMLAEQFPQSRLRLDLIGALFGENGFGPMSEVMTGALEGALFGGCSVGAMLLARRWLADQIST